MIETSIAFGESGGLIGTITMPLAHLLSHSNTGFVFFNAGVVHRVGVHRSNVKIARQIALQGFASIRFDLAGIGDSARADGKLAFAEQAVMDIRAAIDALAAATGLHKFVLFGTCSGTVHSYAAALADERIVGLAMFDSYIYPTTKSRINHFIQRLKKHRSIVSLTQRVMSVSGRVSKRILQRARDSLPASSGVKNERPTRDIGFFAFRPPKAEFAAGLGRLLDRQVKILLIYAGSGFVHYNYAAQFADAFKEFDIAKRVEIAYLRDADHTATRLAAQAVLVACVDQWAAQFVSQSNAKNLSADKLER
jgi:pimeloyl-ACP methyl ester carboxylesterase